MAEYNAAEAIAAAEQAEAVIAAKKAEKMDRAADGAREVLSEFDAAEQMEWLEMKMNSSTADYLWVGGHYPVWAIGNDPPTGVEEDLRPLLNKWEAHYFNGHQHDLEHIVEDHSKVNYVSTGAGKFCCYDDTHLDTVPRNSIKFAMSGTKGEAWMPMPFDNILSGFTSYRVGPESMEVYFHSDNGTVLYITPPIRK